MKIRKKLLLLVLIAAFSIVSAACGKSSPSTASSSADRETITGTLRTEDTAEDVNKESDEGSDIPETDCPFQEAMCQKPGRKLHNGFPNRICDTVIKSI